MASRAHNPLTDAEKATIRRMHADGATRNDIVRALAPRSGDTISRWCARQDPPLTFDREQVKAATEARKADLADRRARLEQTYLERAEDLLQQMIQPAKAFNFGGKDNTYNEHQLDRPPVRDLKDLVHAASIATTASLRIADHGRGAGELSAVDSWLDHIIGTEDTA